MKKVFLRLACLSVIIALPVMVAAQIADFANGKKAFSAGKYVEAIDQLGNVVSKSITNIEAHKLLIEAYVRADMLEDFSGMYKGLKLNNPGNKVLSRQLPEYFYELGLEKKEKKDYILAYGYFYAVSKLRRSFKEVDDEIFYCKRKAQSQKKAAAAKKMALTNYKSAEDAYWKGDYMSAADNMRKALANQPEFRAKANEWMFRGNKDFNLGKYDKAVGGMLLTVTLDIDNEDAHKKLISSLIKIEKLDDLKNIYTGFKQDYPANNLLSMNLPSYFYKEGVAAKAKKQYVEALGSFEVVKILKGAYKDVARQITAVKGEVEKRDRDKKAKSSYANAEKMFKLGKYGDAVKAAKTALKLKPGFKAEGAKWGKTGQMHLGNSKYDLAKGSFLLALALDFNQTTVHKALANLYVDAETLDEFKKTYGAFKKTKGKSTVMTKTVPQSLYDKGKEYKEQSEFLLAKRCFEMVKYLNASYPSVSVQITACDKGIGQLKKQREAQREYMSAVTMFKARKYDQAAGTFGRALKLNPSLKSKAGEWFNEGGKLLKMGSHSQALERLKIAALLDFRNEDNHKTIVKLFLEKEDLKGLKTLYNGYKKSYSGSSVLTKTIPQMLFEEGAVLKGKKEYKDAKKRFGLVQFFAPQFKDVARQIVACDREISRIAERIKLREQGIKDYKLGFKFLQNGNYVKAKTSFKAAADNYPGYEEFKKAVTWGMFKVGAELNQGQYKAAIPKLETIVLLDPDNMNIHTKLISAYRKVNDNAALKATYAGLKKLYPGNKVISNDLAGTYYEQGEDLKKKEQFKLAIQEFKLAQQLGGLKFRNVNVQIQQCNNEIERLKKMEEYRQLAKDAYAAGVKASKGNDFVNIIANFRKASKFDPQYKQLAVDWLPFADKEAKAGKKDNAINYYKVALALNPDDMKAHAGLMDLLKTLGKSKYSSVYKQLKTDYPTSEALKKTIPGQFFNEGTTLMENGDYRLGLAKLTQAAFFNAAYKGLSANIAKCKSQIARLDKIEKNQKQAKASMASATKLFNDGSVKEAVSAIVNAVKLDPRYKTQAADWVMKGKAREKMGKKKEAGNCFRMAIALDPTQKDAHTGLIKNYYAIKYITKLKQLYGIYRQQRPSSKLLNSEVPEYFYQKAKVLQQAKNYEDALVAYRMVIIATPTYKDVTKNITACDKEMRRLAQIASNKKKAKQSYNSGLDLYGKGKLAESLSSFYNAVKLDAAYKREGANWAQKGKVAFKGNKFAKALKDYQVAITIDPDQFEPHIDIIRLYLLDGEVDAIKGIYKGIVAKYPKNVTLRTKVTDVFYKEAMIHKQDQDFDLGIEKFEVVAYLNSTFKDAGKQIVICRNEIAKLKKAKMNAQKAIDIYEAAEGLFDKRQYPAAIAKFAEVISLDSRYKSYYEEWYEKGVKSLKLNKVTVAEAVFKISITLNFEEEGAHRDLINLYLGKKREADFKAYYAKLKAAHKGSKMLSTTLPSFFFRKAEAAIKGKEYDDAKHQLGIVASLNAKYPGIAQKKAYCDKQIKLNASEKQARDHYNKGMQSVMLGDFTEAASWFDKAKGLNPKYGNYMNTMQTEGQTDFKAGKFNEASKKLGMILMKNIKDIEIHKKIIDAGIKSDNLQYLIALYEKVKIEYPFEPVVRRSLPDYYYIRAMKNAKGRDYKRAHSEFKLIQVLKPGFKDVDAQIAKLKGKVN